MLARDSFDLVFKFLYSLVDLLHFWNAHRLNYFLILQTKISRAAFFQEILPDHLPRVKAKQVLLGFDQYDQENYTPCYKCIYP